MEQELIDFKKALKILNVKESWLRKAVFDGLLPYVKIGRLIRFRNSDLIEYIFQNTVTKKKAKEGTPVE